MSREKKLSRSKRANGKEKSLFREHKKTIYILAACGMLSGILFMQGQRADAVSDYYVDRAPVGSLAQQQMFSYELEDGGTGEVVVDVLPKQLSDSEVMALLDEAVATWEESYLGDNPSPDEVRSNLYFPDRMCDGQVQVSYESSDYGLVYVDGTVRTDDLDAAGALVEITASFSCQDTVRQEIRYVNLLIPEEGSGAWMNWRLRQMILERQQEDDTSDQFLMPGEIDGHKVIWMPGEEKTWLYLLLLGVAAAICLEMQGKEAARTQKKKRREQLLYEYPQMVDQISMLICSGMTIRGAWEKLLATDAGMSEYRDGEKRIFIEEMWITYREIRSGGSERQAYESFGQRIGLPPYKRFGNLLAQNLTKGTKDLKQLLEHESLEALELRKNQAIRRGEEAGTKLLLPMLLMFVLILIILLVPAAKQFMFQM